jgi:predicted dehydrogenase
MRRRHTPIVYLDESVFYWCTVTAWKGKGQEMNLSAPASDVSPPAARLILVGVRGFGQVHAERIARLSDQGLVELVAAVDPGVVLDPPTIYGVTLYADLDEALSAVGPVDVVIIAAPLGAHFRLATVALNAGADVYLEKPPVASLDDFRSLLQVQQETGRAVQIGFQSLGSRALEILTEDAMGIGDLVRVSAVGPWSRTIGYWTRSPWAGRRSLGGQPVVDGVMTNALAHAVVTALAIAGCRQLDEVETVETELYRANAIDSDDTSVVRIRTTHGLQVTCALTLCAPVERTPQIHIQGKRGRATFSYTEDRVEIETEDQSRTETTTRVDLLENLLAHRRDGTPLLVPLASTGAFMRVLGAVAAAEEPVRIDPRAITWEGEDRDRRPIVDNVEHWLWQAALSGQTFTELEVPWAHRERDKVLVRARLDDAEVAVYRDGRGTIPTSTPRPYLHPVRTRTGVVVSAQHPADHDWHNGVGMAIPDVNGTHFWGGGTYIHGQGYVLLDNHGVITGEPPQLDDDAFTQELKWLAHDGSVALREQRSIGWTAIDQQSWRLTFESRLRADTEVQLNSPGSKGRIGGGYGGFFWRFPACDDVEVFTAEARGEDQVHGSVAPWVAWSATFVAGPGVSGPATIVISAPDAAAAREPWFVRVHDYPGLGSALAWDRPVGLAAGSVLRRRFDVAVADGRLSEAETSDLAAEVTASRL